MPAEWAPHRRCWMAWPCREGLWGKHFEAAKEAYAEVANAIAQFEPVTMIAPPDELAEVSLHGAGRVTAVPMEIDDSWMRDTGPTFLLNKTGELAGVDWTFNGWGGKFEPYDQDDALPERILDRIEAPRFRAPLVTEGGALHVDGEGTLLAVEETILNDNRNPGMSKQQAEQHLRDYVNVEKIIWLPGGMENDHTDGHVDTVACFAAPAKVIVQVCSDEDDPNHAPLKANLELLKSETDAKGREFEIIEIEQPARYVDPDVGRVPFSYVNFYIANGGLILPTYDDARDQDAFDSIAACFPDRKAVEVPARSLFLGGGGIHCITQQQPRSAKDT